MVFYNGIKTVLNIPLTEESSGLITRHTFLSEKQRSLRILIAEDNLINQKLITRMLENQGHKVVVAENGKKAFSLSLDDRAFDLIFMDIQMPEMNGFEATAAIRNTEKKQILIFRS